MFSLMNTYVDFLLAILTNSLKNSIPELSSDPIENEKDQITTLNRVVFKNVYSTKSRVMQGLGVQLREY